MKSLRELFMDRIVKDKMRQHGIDVETEWLDEYDDLVWDRLPEHLRGPVGAMRENALPLVDGLVGVVLDRLR